MQWGQMQFGHLQNGSLVLDASQATTPSSETELHAKQWSGAICDQSEIEPAKSSDPDTGRGLASTRHCALPADGMTGTASCCASHSKFGNQCTVHPARHADL